MKRAVPFVVGFVFGAIVFGASGAFFGYSLVKSGEPALVVFNASLRPVASLKVETDVGESYHIADLLPQKACRIKISGRDKALWMTASTSAGKSLTSNKTYVTSEGILFAIISDDSIVINYEL